MSAPEYICGICPSSPSFASIDERKAHMAEAHAAVWQVEAEKPAAVAPPLTLSELKAQYQALIDGKNAVMAAYTKKGGIDEQIKALATEIDKQMRIPPVAL